MPSDDAGWEATGQEQGRGRWFLGGLAVVVVAIVVVGMVVERGTAEPEAADQATTGTGAGPWVTSAGPPVSTTSSSSSAASAPAGQVRPRYAFPVNGTSSYARTHHDYPATDIIAACGAAVVAVTAGLVLETSRTDSYDPRADDGAVRGGLFVSILGDDGVRYYGSHLSAVAVGVDPGTRVNAGQRIGTVGDSGHASGCHLHFGISPPCARVGDWWVRRGVQWPWSYLDSWRRGGVASPAGSVVAWGRTHGCPGAPAPSTGR